MPEQKVPAKAACAVAMTAATGAAVCAGICVLPFALPAVAIAGFSSMIALLAGALAWVTALAVAIVAGAWILVGWQSFRSRARPARSTLYAMGGATALTMVAVMWRQIEPAFIRMLLG